MKNLTFKAAMLKGSQPTVNRRSTDGQSQRRYSLTPITKRWRALMMVVFLFTLGISQMWAAQETVPKFNNNWEGTSINFSHDEGANGSADATKDGDASNVTYIKFRTNKNGNTITLNVNTGYKVTGLSIRGYANDDDKDVELASVKYDSADPIAVNQSFPKGKSKTSGTTYTYSNTTNEATSAIVLSFGTNAGTQIMAVMTVTYEEISGGCSAPTDPAISGTTSYTEGDNISLTASATGATSATFTWYKGADWATASAGSSVGTGATLAINSCATSDAGTYWCNISNGTGCEVQESKTITVAAAPAVCPSGVTISGTQAYTEGETISLTAALTEGNGTISYQWYKGSIAAGNEVGTGATFTKANCETSDEGDYFCVASKDACSNAESSAYAITVAAVSYCAELVPATSGDAPASGGAISLTTATGGSMKALTANISYTANGLLFGSSSSTKAEVTLNHLMQVGTVITATIYNDNDDKSRGLNLLNSSGTSKATWTKKQTGDHVETYTVVAGDGLAGSNVFQLQRNNNAYLKSITVSNCGAELHALTSAIDPAAAEGKATITLSKSLVAAGATATATYSAIDAAYDFDEWVISGATIDNPKANPVTITMGSTDAIITLKLKAASVKYAVHFDSKGGSAVDDQLVETGQYASVPTAPTKFKYTFGGWSETDGGSTPADLGAIAITGEKTFYAIWTEKVCPTSGTIFSVSAKSSGPTSEVKWTNADNEGVRDVSDYFDVVNGIAALVNNSSSNNQVSITTDPKMKFSNDANGWAHLRLECALAEGDVITLDNSNKCIVSYTADKAEGTTYTLPNSTSHTITVPASWAGEDELYIFRNGSNFYISSISIVRPVKYAVTFNMHGHGDQVATQNITEGGKVTEPATTDITGWDFGGWYQNYVAEPESYSDAWDFANDVVGTSAIELHAKWTEHVASSDATLSSLSYTIGGGDPIAIALVTDQYAYNVELPMGADIDAPVIAAEANDPNIKNLTIVQTNLGVATVSVTAEDNLTVKNYTITFSAADHKDIQLVFKTGTTPCVGSASTATQILSNNAAVSTYINQITFTNVEGAGDDGAEGSSLNVGKKAGNMFTLSAKAGYALQSMNFLAKIQDATCEYSIDGGAWTELASTNTGGDECYAPFTSGTVHEFRLRSTGTSGVWIRNMQLTIVEACTPIVLAWDAEPVEFEVGKAGQAIAATANNGGTVAYSSTDGAIIAVDAVNGTLSVAALGSVTLKAVTAEGDGSTYCANAGNDIEISKVVNTYYLVSFDADNGDAVTEIKYYYGDAAIALPAAPVKSGYDFQGWFNGSDEITSAITPTASMNIVAHWETSYAAMIVGGDSYATFAEAVANVADDQTIKLLQNCSYPAMWEIAGMTVTLDLNGQNLTYTGSGRAVEVQAGGNLILEDASATVAPTIDLTQSPLNESAVTYTSGVFELVDGIRVINGGTLTINSGRYEATEGVALVKFTGSTVTVNDGVLISRDNGVIMGNGTSGQGGYIMNINGGILIGKIVSSGYASMVVYHPNVGELNITDGVLVSTNGPAVVVRAGESDITGGTIIAQGSGSGKCGDASLVLPAVGVAYDFKSAYPGVSSIDATISGTANVTGEAGAVQAIYAAAEPTAAEESKVNISGGTFNTQLTKAVCAEGYVPSEAVAPGVYTVVPKAPLCLAWIDVTGQNAASLDASKSFLAPEISAAGIKNSSTYGGKTGWKFNSSDGSYVAIENAPFETGDVVEVFVTTVKDDKMRVFNANEAIAANVVAEGAANMVQGANQVTLTADANNLYLRRGNDFNGWNPYVAYIAVYRAYPNPLIKEITFNGAAGTVDNTLKTIVVEVPASTDFGTMPVIASFLSNDPSLTNGAVTGGTWAEGVNEYTVTDKDGDQTVYTVTISKAVASSDATLATLTYGTPATAIALADGVFEYNVELPYGTSAVPALAATAHHAGANVTDIDDAAAFVNRHATSTVTVTAEDGTTTQLYTVNFTVSRFESKVLWDGSTMTDLSEITAAATAAGVTATTTGISVTSFSAKTCEENGKSYTRALNIGGNTKSTRYFAIEIPAGKVAKVSLVYKANGNDARSIIIGTALASVVDESAITVVEKENDQLLHVMTAEMFGGGTLYINTTNGFQVHEISLQLADGFARSSMLGAGVLGTVCVPNNVAIEDIQGVTVYELMGRDYNNYGKLAFDEIISGELEAGAPYVFVANGNHMALLYGATHVDNPVDKGNGMYGTFTDQTLTELDDVYYFAQRALWSCDGLASLSLPANRAYVKLSEIGEVSSPTPNPARRRITMAVNGEKVATGIDNLEASEKPLKLMIDGQMYILRGEKLFDATGRLVK